ncbi:VOC family protein [Vibrio sp. HN007]|uniref:VOC family protein n=1 Tax=Vibrio iocasae TaxID=3098914 RepID=UPI0035D4B68E
MSNSNINIAVWFEIPAIDFQRAINFYQTVFDVEIVECEMNELKQGLFPHDDKALVSGSIVCGENYTPSTQGTMVYLNGGEDLSISLSKVESSGGKILLPKVHLGPEIGYIAHFTDTEGNRIGLHSMQ